MKDETDAVGLVAPASWFGSAEQVADLLRGVGYLADQHVCAVLRLASQLGKPVLVEGPAGTGKTELAASAAAATASRLIRLQCHEGLDEARTLYEWNHSKQLLRLLAGQAWTGVFTGEFLLPRPLLEAITAAEPVVLLIDEVDRLAVEAEALLLEILSDYQVSIPELGTMTGRQVPMVFLTSNGSRDLTEALRRRCLYLHIDYPSVEREREIVLMRVPGIAEHLAEQIAGFVASLRRGHLRQRPSVPQTLEWARALLALGAKDLDAGLASESLPSLLAYESDIELAARLLAGCLPEAHWPASFTLPDGSGRQQPRKPSTACRHRMSDGVPKWSTPRSVTSRASGSEATRPSPGLSGS
jgi:MoxR-like ATPase